ncbi:hypothetical protein HG442_002860 [Candidatus Gracilibacteria bacterium]|nr:hypothetical protein [Candidatus Gracilibacteria bacterium]
MFFLWACAIASIFFFVLANTFTYAIAPLSQMTWVFLVLVACSPILIPLNNILNGKSQNPMKDSEKSFFTIRNFVGFFCAFVIFFGVLAVFRASFEIAILWTLWFVGIFFAIDSRIFYGSALVTLLMVIFSILAGQNSVADSLSLLVYIFLVIGVSSEFLAPMIRKIPLSEKPLILIDTSHDSDFEDSYKKELSLYSWWAIFLIQCTFFALQILQNWINIPTRLEVFFPILFVFFGILFFVTTPKISFFEFYGIKSKKYPKMMEFLLILLAIFAMGLIYFSRHLAVIEFGFMVGSLLLVYIFWKILGYFVSCVQKYE